MKTTKRLLALNLVLVLLLTLVPAAALADVGMKLDEYVSFTKEENSEENAEFTFTPDEDGAYQINITRPKYNSTSECLVFFGYTVDGKNVEKEFDSDNFGEWEWITGDDGDDGDVDIVLNMEIICELNAGVEYAISFDNNSNGNYKAKIKYLGEAKKVAEINETNFPDEKFREYVTKYDINGDNALSNVETAQVKTIDIGWREITSIKGIGFFTSLEYLYCSGNWLTELPTLPESLTNLYCSNNQLTNLPTLPASLTYLRCSGNRLTELPANLSQLDNLWQIDCSENLLEELPELPANLQYLYCNNNKLKSLSSNVSELGKLTYIDCSYNQLEKLPDLLTTIRSLDCSFNPLTVLPTDLSKLVNLYELSCAGIGLKELPTLPANIRYLDCSGNELTNVEEISSLSELHRLYCSGNELAKLPALPESLNELCCWNNQLTELPTLPKRLSNLYCNDNQLTKLPTLPQSLSRLYCYNNKLTSIALNSDADYYGINVSGNSLSDYTAVTGKEIKWDGENYIFGVQNHDHNFIEEVTQAVTCNTYGRKTVTCTKCGYSLDESIEPTGHNYGNNNWCQNCATYRCEAREISHDFNDAHQCTMCGGYECMLTNVLHEFDENGCCTVCEKSIPDTYYGEDGSVWTLTKDGLLTISGANYSVYYNNAENYFGPFLQNTLKIVCGDGTTFFESYYKFSNVEEIDFGKDVATIASPHSMISLKTVTVDAENPYLCVVDGVLYNTDQTELLIYPKRLAEEASSSITVKDSVKTIGENAFYDNGALYFVLPEGIVDIELEAFRYCRQMQTIYIPSTVTSIGMGAFYKCSQLKNVYFGGTQEQWNAINKDNYNDCLTNAELTVDHQHTAVEVAQYPSWCTHIGHEAGTACSECGKIISGCEAIPVLGHNYADVAAVDPTCIIPGSTEGQKCTRCNKTIGCEEIPALGHNFTGAKAATCTEDGYTGEGKCSRCNEVSEGKVINAADHTLVVDRRIAATCTETGLTEGKHCSACGNVTVEQEIIPAKGHTERLINAKDATCTEAGYTGDTVCIVCAALVKEGTEIPSSGHSYTEEVTAPTCTTEGYTKYTCSNCNSWYINDYVNALGHNYVDGVCTVCDAEDPDYVEPVRPSHSHSYAAAVTAPTCTEKGYTTYTCSCGSSFVGNYVDAKGHTEVTDAAVAATCTTTGLTEGKHCSECNEVLVKQEVIPASAHEFKDGVCTACGAKDPSVNPFNDVAETSPYAEAVSWAYANNITVGKTDDTFGVNDGCTCGQIVTLLWRAAGSPAAAADTVNPFSDVSADSNYYDAIMWAVANGITYGTTATTFSPDTVCTRGQIVTFMYRAAGSPKVDTGVGFTDVDESSYCYDAVAWAVANGITVGKTDTTFAPSETCTRGQAVTFMYRASADK